jgi:hypothetical protein
MMLGQNSIGYLQPSYDPWITALIAYNGSVSGTNFSEPMWLASTEVSLMVCVDQYQVCNPNKPGNSGCSKLGGLMSASTDAFGNYQALGWNLPQVYTISRLLGGSTDRSMFSVVDGRSGAALNGITPDLSLNLWFQTNWSFCLSIHDGLRKYSVLSPSDPMAERGLHLVFDSFG